MVVIAFFFFSFFFSIIPALNMYMSFYGGIGIHNSICAAIENLCCYFVATTDPCVPKPQTPA